MSEVVDNPARHRYEISVDGLTAFTTYRIADGIITFVHTEVPPALGGREIGSRLAAGALAITRARGLKVVATCPFISAYIGKHAEWQDLLA